jgi:hypothetical protein
MPRKVSDNLHAREAARDFLTSHATNADDSALVVDLFPSVEFETAQSKVGGEPVKLRRITLTGPWEVVNQ